MPAPTAAELQALWTLAPITPPPERSPATPPETARCCHSDRRRWIDRPDKRRSGWIRTTCGLCGGFVGYRPPDHQRTKQTNDDI
ncbi:hypothetical protein [Novipirellula artificiosorum]|uniref:hypothetical protein n=1 Tax=Novipirellula artificiosorum TaxID=2528016 RepID=UPI0011B5B839|nr:hypothetical protein [Novipirellula artificiosorum]